jgi:hypothetical protein
MHQKHSVNALIFGVGSHFFFDVGCFLMVNAMLALYASFWNNGTWDHLFSLR